MADLLSGGKSVEFYTPRMFKRKAVYLNKSNTKWIEIGVVPGEEFLPVAYFCGKGCQVQIPCSLEDFIDKIGALSGVSPSGTAKSVLIKAADSSFDILSITKADYASGMYKIFNVSDPDRAAYTTTATLSYLREIGRPMKNLYNHLNPADVKEEFDKIVMWGSKLANHVETTDYELIEAELFQHPSHDLDPEMLYEILTNFRNFFWRQLRIQMKKQN